MEYRIVDLNKGLLADDIKIDASGARQALEKCGYKNIVVYGNRGSYAYSAVLEMNKEVE